MAAVGQARMAQMARGARVFTEPQSLQPPIGGWNTRDPFGQMDPLDAIQLDNWYPDYAGCVTRPGCRVFGTTDGVNPVYTLAVWRHGNRSALVGASGGKLWDSSGGLVSDSLIIGEGYGRDWWGWSNFQGRLVLCNGIDPVQEWQGPGGPNVAASGFTIDPASGFDPTYISAMLGCFPIHNRLFFWTGRDAGFWYGDLQSIAGPLHYFPFDMLTPDPGAVININVLTFDAGTGINTYTTFFLSTGVMISYAGTDPTNAANWSLAGVYQIASPVGPQTYPNRSVLNYGGDVYLTTSSDHHKLSQFLSALIAGQNPPRSKASGAVIAATAQGAALPGWQAIYWGYRRRVYFNVPLTDGSFQQHVYNAERNAWARNLGMKAYCWVIYNERLFYGSEEGMIIEHGPPEEADNDQIYFQHTPWRSKWGSPWAKQIVRPIMAVAQQAWNEFATPLDKRVAAVRAIVRGRATSTVEISLGYDYGRRAQPVLIPVNLFGADTKWGSRWGSPWSALDEANTDWVIGEGDGSVIGMGLTAQAYDLVTWTRSDFRIEPGSAL